MKWQSLSAFWAMGGYGTYIWGSYLVTAGLLAAEIAFLVRRKRRGQFGAATGSSANTHKS